MEITKNRLAGMKKSFQSNPAMRAASLAISLKPVDEVVFDA